MLGNARIKLDIHTDHPEERPGELPLLFVDETGTERRIPVPVAEFPLIVTLPKLPVARALRGLPHDTGPVEVQMWTFHPTVNALNQILFSHRANAVDLGRVSLLPFARMLAKIGHAYAVAELGHESIEACSTDFIRGIDAGANNYVGSNALIEEPSPHLHYINHLEQDSTGIIVVTIRLFANLGAPTYQVVVGRRKRPGR
jgi:hypothetical protein